MVAGLDTFRTFFADHTDAYVLIGGAACDILFDRAGLDFRATKDLDMVICVEVVKPELATQFAAFLEKGGYQVWATSQGDKKFFRFEKPTDKTFPFMLELFARPPAAIALPPDDRYVKLDVEDDILSLSALLLDDAYYAALKSGQTVVDGVSVLNETLLIPFKARAFLDLSEREAKGEKVKGGDIKKHRQDVFRLLQLIPGDAAISLPEALAADLKRFVASIEADASFDPKAFGMEAGRDAAIAQLKTAFSV